MGAPASPFRRVRSKGTPPPDPEALFKELHGRSPEIRDLFSHQADILRAYAQQHLESPDVSLELPTGSGKTLVGLLIAEFRRRIRRERVLYLCPTRQLAHQVGEKAKEYGIDAKVLVGPKKDFPTEDIMSFRGAKCIAVSTYGAFFNVSPGLYDPQTIILDDAHDAESHIARMWSTQISRRDRLELYNEIVSLLEPALPKPLALALYEERRPRRYPQPWMLPFGSAKRLLPGLRALLDKATPNPEGDPELYFSWTTVRDGLSATCLYISWDEILVRPYIPPSLTHPPFARALQRVYMSATLGEGGELERSTGVRKILRIPTPKTYASHAVGRRLFVFPDLFQSAEHYEGWLLKCISRRTTPRTLVLAPNSYVAEAFKNLLAAGAPGVTLLSASDIENTLAPFRESPRSALILTGRYDGIDLPHEDCRQIVIESVPSGTNLQEAFLERTLGLEVLLRERTKTRIAQGSGRCTRSDTDYAVVIMHGRSLADFCVRTENQVSFHPELRAEIQFALDQRPDSFDALDSMVDSFLAQNNDWKLAEQDIRSLRSEEAHVRTEAAVQLARVVQDEVEFAYAIWAGNHATAVERARGVVDRLSDKSLAPYRAFWAYNVASAAALAGATAPEFGAVERAFLSRAAEACRTVSWFAYAIEAAAQPRLAVPEEDQIVALGVDGVLDFLTETGIVGPRYHSEMEETDRLLSSSDSDDFDQGLVRLGTLLGFDSTKPPGQGPPDAVWRLGSRLVVLFEGKAGDVPEGPISIKDCRQAGGHRDWAAAQPLLKDCTSVRTILVSPRGRVNPAAIAHASELYYISPQDARGLFSRAKSAIDSLRAAMVEGQGQDHRELTARHLESAQLDATKLLQWLTRTMVVDLPKEK